MNSLVLPIAGKPSTPTTAIDTKSLTDSRCSLVRLTTSIVTTHVLPFLASGRTLLVSLSCTSRSYRELMRSDGAVTNSIWFNCLWNDFTSADFDAADLKSLANSSFGRQITKRDLEQLTAPRKPRVTFYTDTSAGSSSGGGGGGDTKRTPDTTTAAFVPASAPPGTWRRLYYWIARAVYDSRTKTRALFRSASPAPDETADYRFRLRVLGIAGCGKSSLIYRFGSDAFLSTAEWYNSRGFDLRVKTLAVPTSTPFRADQFRAFHAVKEIAADPNQYDGPKQSIDADTARTRRVKLQVWDTQSPTGSGMPAYGGWSPLHHSSVRNVCGVVVCHPIDKTSPESLSEIGSWIDQFMDLRMITVDSLWIPVFVAVTKCDGEVQSESKTRIARYADAWNEANPTRTIQAVYFTSSKDGSGVHELFNDLAARVLHTAELVDVRDGKLRVVPHSPASLAVDPKPASGWSCSVQ